MNMTEIMEHEYVYNQSMVNSKVQRHMQSRLLAEQWTYKPPEFVPNSFKQVEEEEEIKKAEEKVK